MLKNDRKQYQSEKVADKIEFCKTRNKIVNTDFLDMADRAEVQKFLNEQKVKNYFFEGGKENADRSILVFYPEKLTEEMARKNISNILEVIRIKLPKELKYEHREYLSGIMKLGLKREKFGDIIVNDSGADIVALKDVSEYLKNGLQDLTRFRKSKIEIVSIFELKNIETKFEEMSIIVSSLRLDNFVSELARCSRTRAEEIILEQRVFVNSIMVEKASKKINEGDIITIRGKGKFIFSELQRETRNDRLVLNIKKYI
jgi:RNA-binding protein YlmH